MTTLRSEPKQKIIEFVKATRVTDDTTAAKFEFLLVGNEEDAKKFVHRMRVELSRLRDTVRRRNREPREFKMLVIGYEFNSETNRTKVSLQRAEGKLECIDPEVLAAFDDLAI